MPHAAAETLRAGDAAVRHYRRDRRRQFAPDLMGYREGPPLPPPSEWEQTEIEESVRFRKTFALNTSRLLIRRLLRDRSKEVEDSITRFSVPLAPPEARGMSFRDELRSSRKPLLAYMSQCAKDEDGGLYLADLVPKGVVLVVNVTGRPRHHLRELRARFAHRGVMRVRKVTYSERYLRALSNRLVKDSDALEGRGLDISEVAVDVELNRVAVGLKNPSPMARRVLVQRYGRAVYMEPRPQDPVVRDPGGGD